MNREELQAYIGDLAASLTYEEGAEWINVFVEPAAFRELMLKLRADEQLAFDYMFCLTCVDWKTHLTMVYHLSSTRYRYNIVVKSKLDRTKPEIETICDIWRTAEFHEREVFELFGVTFLNHPDLRLLILPDGWEGKNPMRKDYEDEVNMIKL
jgi:NADH:ubiquinone oxidoreductase subunit C